MLALAPSSAETLAALGQQDAVVAVAEATDGEAFRNLPRVVSGAGLQREQALLARPTHAVGLAGFTRSDDLSFLRAQGIVVLELRMDRPEDVPGALDQTARALGVPDSLLAGTLRARISSLRATPPAPRPSLILLALDPPAAVGPETYTGRLFAAAGFPCVQPADWGAWPVLQREQVALLPMTDVFVLDPSVDALPGWLVEARPEPLTLHALDPDPFLRAGPRLAEALDRLERERQRDTAEAAR